MTSNQAKKLRDKLWDICILCEGIAYHDITKDELDEYESLIFIQLNSACKYLVKVIDNEN